MPPHDMGLIRGGCITPARHDTVDVSHAQDRIELAGLGPSWTGITLLCTVKEAQGNQRVNSQDRFVLNLQDGSGERELSCWGEGSGLVAPLRAGDCVLFEGLHTTGHKQGGFQLRGQIPEMSFCLISSLPGLLGSPHIAPKVPLKAALSLCHAVVKVKVMGWPNSHTAMRQTPAEACSQCHRALLDGGCDHCQIPFAGTQGDASPALVQVGNLLVGDGTAMVQAGLSPHVLEFLAQAGSDGLATMSAQELRKRLDETTGKQFMMLICQVTGVDGVLTHRIDAIADVNQGAEEAERAERACSGEVA